MDNLKNKQTKQCLVIHDQPDFVFLLKKRIKNTNIDWKEICLANLESNEKINPNLVIIDLDTRYFDVWKALQKVLSFKENVSPIPILALTSSNERQKGLLAIQRGASQYFVKGENLGLLKEKVESLLI